MHGDLESALLLHPLSPVLVPLVLAAAVRAAFVHVRGASAVVPPAKLGLHSWQSWQSWLGCLLAGLVLALWGARFLGAFGGPVRVISVWGH